MCFRSCWFGLAVVARYMAQEVVLIEDTGSSFRCVWLPVPPPSMLGGKMRRQRGTYVLCEHSPTYTQTDRQTYSYCRCGIHQTHVVLSEQYGNSLTCQVCALLWGPVISARFWSVWDPGSLGKGAGVVVVCFCLMPDHWWYCGPPVFCTFRKHLHIFTKLCSVWIFLVHFLLMHQSTTGCFVCLILYIWKPDLGTRD